MSRTHLKLCAILQKNGRASTGPIAPNRVAVLVPPIIVALVSLDGPESYEDASRWYRFRGFKATVQLEAIVHVPSIGFEFKTDALEKSKAEFTVMGEEVNGKYYG